MKKTPFQRQGHFRHCRYYIPIHQAAQLSRADPRLSRAFLLYTDHHGNSCMTSCADCLLELCTVCWLTIKYHASPDASLHHRILVAAVHPIHRCTCRNHACTLCETRCITSAFIGWNTFIRSLWSNLLHYYSIEYPARR